MRGGGGGGLCPRALVVDSCENAPAAQCLCDDGTKKSLQLSREWLQRGVDRGVSEIAMVEENLL